MGPRLKVSSNRMVKPGIKPAIPGFQGKRFIHYTTAAPVCGLSSESEKGFRRYGADMVFACDLQHRPVTLTFIQVAGL